MNANWAATGPNTDTPEWDDLMHNLGLTPSNRPTPPPPARNPIRHGTYSGYRAHRRYSETPCPACREASNEYDRNRYAHQQAAKEAA